MDTKGDKKTLLAIFAHSDDELGCVGTMANYTDAGHEVVLAFLTKGENATTVAGNADEIANKRREHTQKIEELLKVKVRYLDFIDSQIAHTVENGYKVAELIKEIKPHILISWSKMDRVGGGHPDHRNCADIVRDAISYARYKREGSEFEPHRDPVDFYTYLNQDMPTKRIQYVDVTDQVERITEFINIYKEAYGDWPVDKFKESSMVSHGMQCGVKFAEAFTVINRSTPANKVLH